MIPGWHDALATPTQASRSADPALIVMEAASPAPSCPARRLRLVLGAIAAISVWSLSAATAVASLGKASHRGQSHVAAGASKQMRPSRPVAAASKRVHLPRRAAVVSKPLRPDRAKHAGRVRSRAAPMRAATHRTMPVHAGVVPLVNTVWDDPALSPPVRRAIRDAARDTNVDPGLLMALAWRESRFDPQAINHQSSATGLLQFTSGTWLQTIREFGAQHGAGGYAAAIRKDQSGELTVRSPRVRTAILKLRSDPVLSTRLAAETLGRQRAAMQVSLGRDVTAADLYLRHVLGPSGAAQFLAAMAERPSASTLQVASSKTLRNAGLLARDGRPMTVASTYAAIQAMLDGLQARSELLLASAAR